MTSKYTMALEWEQVDSIIKSELKTHFLTLLDDLDTNLKDGTAKVFDNDPVKDRAMIREHIHAFRLVLAYMGETDIEGIHYASDQTSSSV